MNALYSWLTLRAQGFSERLNAWVRVFRFAVTAFIGVLSPSTYNKATRLVVQKQIYFTAWQILPGFAVFAALFSFLIIEIVRTSIDTASAQGYRRPLLTYLNVQAKRAESTGGTVALQSIQKRIDPVYQSLPKA